MPTSVPSSPYADVGLNADGLWLSSFRAMASPVRLQQTRDSAEPHRRHAEVQALFAEVERQCTRFDPASDLMRANAAGAGWARVGAHCFDALVAAEQAHRVTAGRFDPRVLGALLDLGYATSLPFTAGDVRTPAARPAPPRATGRWEPRFDRDGSRVSVGTVPVDLGGIGKGLALRWAAALLARAGCPGFLLEAGGDCVYGDGPGGLPWRLAVEDPAGGREPVAVLQVARGATATSSTRLRHWTAGGRPVHHLIDPTTGSPGGGDLRAVTVIGADPADAEVWAKVLFLHGAAIEDAAAEHGVAALWVDAGGRLDMNDAMRPYVIWERS
ncbi:MAG TPA: FAD:protein FMN transferase [Jatrophihabitans sp.]|nr:FAD:protein FMN transferase [Jatrophihabitans sp.]